MLDELKKVFPIFTNITMSIAWLMIFGGAITWIALWSVDEFMLGLIIGGSILMGGILLIIDYIIAGYFYFAAVDKGYTTRAYLVMPFVLGLIGYLLVCALPHKGNADATVTVDFNQNNGNFKNVETSTNNINYTCPNCGKTVTYGDAQCACGQAFDWSNL